MQLIYRGCTYELTASLASSQPKSTQHYQGQAPMQLIYRGSTYTASTAALEVSEAELTGKYRGLPVSFKASVGVAQPRAVATLTYRGNQYLRVS